MSPAEVERRLAAILSADVAGYSRLMAENESDTVRLIKAHRDMMGGLVRQHAGRVVDAVGDNLLAEFASVVDAVSCAVAIQSEIANRNRETPPDRGMRSSPIPEPPPKGSSTSRTLGSSPTPRASCGRPRRGAG